MGVLADYRLDVAVALGDACDGHSNWSVYPLPVESPTPPCYLLLWSDPWLAGPATVCRYNAQLEVRLIGPRLVPDTGIEMLEAMIEAAAVELHKARLPFRIASRPAPYDIDGIRYQSAVLLLETTVDITTRPSDAVEGTARFIAVPGLSVAGTIIPAPLTITGTPAPMSAAAALAVDGNVIEVGVVAGRAAFTAAARLATRGTVVGTPYVEGVALLSATAGLTVAGDAVEAGVVTGQAQLSAAASLAAVGTTTPTATIDAAALLTAGAHLVAAGDVVPVTAWTPADLPGIDGGGYWDASNLTTITATAGKVSQWVDVVNGRRLLQPVAGNQPTTGTAVNGHNSLGWVPDDNTFMDSDVFAMVQPFTTLILLKPTAPLGNPYLLRSLGADFEVLQTMVDYYGVGVSLGASAGAGFGASWVSGSSADTFQTVTVFHGAASHMRYNADATPNEGAPAGDSGPLNWNAGYRLGHYDGTNPGYGYRGQVLAVVILAAEPSPDDLANWDAWCAAKGGTP